MVRQGFQPLPGQRREARGQQHHEQENPSPKLRFLALQILRRAGAPSSTGRKELGDGAGTGFRVRGKAKSSITQTIVIILTGRSNPCCWRIWYAGADLG